MKADPNKIESLVTPIVEAMGYIVWHIELRQINRNILVRINVDVPIGDERRGVTVDDCGTISKQVAALFDIEEPISGSYVLEVSSPGLDRSLFKLEHYQRYVGRMVHIVLRQSIDERRDFTGRIQEVSANTLKLAVGDRVIDVDITNISKAKLTLDL